MKYPTLEEVEKADRVQLARWYRFLQSPGTSAVTESRAVSEVVLGREGIVMDRIAERFKAMGGFTPAISKEIGWG